MIMRSALSTDKSAPAASLLLDSSMSYPLALDQDGWKKAGMSLASLVPLPQDPKLKQGLVPLLRLGAYDIPEVPAIYGTPIAEVEKGMEVDLDGIVGSGLLAAFRVTLTDGGRAMWLEDVPTLREGGPPPARSNEAPGRGSDAPPGGAAPPAAASPAAPPASKSPAGGAASPTAPKAPAKSAPSNKKAPEGPPIAQ
jgi:hypothetical protein